MNDGQESERYMNETEIRYLQREEKMESRALYELCFPEDTKKFTDYYYKEKCRDNNIAALYSGRQMVTMVHGNPFTVSMCGSRVRVSYIVAVATHPDYRRQGLMRMLLGRVLHDCYKNGEPFSFLMPADAAYYESMGYRFWDSQIEWKFPEYMEIWLTERLSDADLKGRRITVAAEESEMKAAEISGMNDRFRIQAVQRKKEEEENAQLADFANRILEQNFDLYICRDAAYYERLGKEQQSEDGDVAILRYKSGELMGSFCYSTEDGVEIREPILMENIEESHHPAMMGRIVHLQNFVKNLRFSTPFYETISLNDDIIPENNGVFRIYIDAAGGKAERVHTSEGAKVMDIAELGRILFDKMRIFINELV